MKDGSSDHMKSENVLEAWRLWAIREENTMLISETDQFVKVARSEMLRRATQELQQNRAPDTDERFQSLLNRLLKAEESR